MEKYHITILQNRIKLRWTENGKRHEKSVRYGKTKTKEKALALIKIEKQKLLNQNKSIQKYYDNSKEIHQNQLDELKKIRKQYYKLSQPCIQSKREKG